VTSRDLVLSMFEGEGAQRFPVAIPYAPLTHREHWEEITGEPAWTWHRWRYADPDEHLKGYLALDSALPFDILEPIGAPSPEVRERTRVEKRAEGCFVVDTRTGEQQRVSEDLHHMEPGPNERRTVFNRKDADEHITITPAERTIAAGANDYRRKVVETLGRERFILSGGVAGAFWNCTFYVGETNLLILMREDPGLVDYLCARLTERLIEHVRVLAAGGGDAIFLDDALMTAEMVSVADYERFSMPYAQQVVDEIHAQGMKAILIYFGGVADRVEHIASLKADGLLVETTMKNYVNDIGDIASRLGGRMVLFGNIDPVGVLWRGSDERLCAEIERQGEVGRRYGRFIMSTGSPITPGTPLARIRRFIDLARSAPLGA